ncbi:MAG: DMT family transporter [Balneolales bacterium]|nr:DMT family transporter [Balneolales bacterium]
MIKKYFTEFTLLVVAIIWALNFTVVKVSLEELDPFSFNALRYFFAAALLIVAAKRAGFKISVKKEHFWKLVGIGLVGNLFYQVLFIIGMDFTLAANAAVILGTIPVWVALLSYFFTDEKLSLRKTAGIVLAFAGVVLIIVSRPEGLSLSSRSLIGDIILLLSAIAWASYTILSKKYLKIYHSTQYSGFMALVGVIALFIVGVPSLIKTDFNTISIAGYGGIVYSGLLSVGLSYLVWNRGIAKIGAVNTAIYQNLVPVLGVVFGVILLGEQLMVFQYIGGIFVILGIAITQTR